MAELPNLVRVKRKRGDEPTADLFLEERSFKRQQVWQFRLQQPHPSHNQADAISSDRPTHHEPLARREFRLARPSRPVHRRIESVKRKAIPDPQDIPTFVEASPKRRRVSQDHVSQPLPQSPAPTTNTLKRPGASARLKKPTAETLFQSPANPPPDRLTDALHRFALEEDAREVARTKPKVTAIPKKPVQRYRDRHPEEFAAQNARTQQKKDTDVEMSDDEEYVYDTYIRTKDPVVPFALDSKDPANDHVGYIVISEEDQPLWETYFGEDGDTDKEFDTDDEDENGKSLPFALPITKSMADPCLQPRAITLQIILKTRWRLMTNSIMAPMDTDTGDPMTSSGNPILEIGAMART